MGQPISEALKLMLIGMGTVFSILIFVVILGNLIIMVTNRLSTGQPAIPAQQQNGGQEIDPKKLAVIISTVEVVTGGRGKIISISKSNQ